MVQASTSADTWDENEGGHGPTFVVHPHLFLALDADRPCSGGARYSLADVDEVVLGRGSTRRSSRERDGALRRLTVRTPGGWLSSTHARIFSSHGRWHVEDSGSKNGTFLNGVAIQRAELTDGDVIDVGHTLFVFRAALPTPPGTPLDHEADAGGWAAPTLLPEPTHRLDELLRVARSNVPVLLLGETGTGKEVLARAIHAASARSGSFVAINCGALSSSLLESLLFGHVRGAFSGAVRDEPGLVRSADGGTLLLDEIGDMPASGQAALLRVLQEREVVPVGGVRPIKVDVRFVAATHRPLDELRASGAFRADLFARLDGFSHALAPLRERREDLGLIAGAILSRTLGARAADASIDVAAARALFRYDWPANVRELEQCLSRAVAIAQAGAISLAHFPDAIAGRAARSSSAPAALSASDQRLKDELVAALRAHRGNVSEVARAMRKARMQIQRWVKRFALDPDDFR